MNKFILVFSLLVFGCKTENKEIVNKVEKNQSLGNFEVKYIEVEGNKIQLLVPPNQVYEDKLYDEYQAAKIIHMNLSPDIQKKIAPSRLEKLINFQGNYIDAQEQLNENYIGGDDANIEFLHEKSKSLGSNLSKEEIFTILRYESYYMKLINY